jgi:pimeloyl-ACP methyl ester carboxylesterase
VRSLIVAGWSREEVKTDFAGSPQYQAWLSAYIAWIEQLKTQTHAKRMVAALSQLPPGAPLPPEDEYVPWVEASAQLDLNLVRLGAELWARLGAEVRAVVAALDRIECPVLIMKSEFFPQPGAPQSVREEASDRLNVRIVRFENTGHLIYREQFEPFVPHASAAAAACALTLRSVPRSLPAHVHTGARRHITHVGDGR